MVIKYTFGPLSWMPPPPPPPKRGHFLPERRPAPFSHYNHWISSHTIITIAGTRRGRQVYGTNSNRPFRTDGGVFTFSIRPIFITHIQYVPTKPQKTKINLKIILLKTHCIHIYVYLVAYSVNVFLGAPVTYVNQSVFSLTSRRCWRRRR